MVVELYQINNLYPIVVPILCAIWSKVDFLINLDLIVLLNITDRLQKWFSTIQLLLKDKLTWSCIQQRNLVLMLIKRANETKC